jgi:hypothetical protein
VFAFYLPWLACLAIGCTAESLDADDSDTDGDTDGAWASLEERPCPEDSFLTYENFGEPYMRSYCTGCHSSMLEGENRGGAPSAVNLDDLDAVREHAGRVWARAADQNATMPPAGAPGDEERALLGEWLACGAKTGDEK